MAEPNTSSAAALFAAVGLAGIAPASRRASTATR